MTLARVHTWVAGEVLTASDLNAEFNNILNNPTALITPLVADLALGTFSLTGLGAGSASTPSLSFTGDANTGLYSSAAESIDLVGRGGRVLQASGFADGVNFVRVSNAPTGQSPAIEAAGTDTNVGLRLVAKGSGYVEATSFRFGVFSATQSADHEGRAYWHKSEGTLHIVAGTLMGRVPAITAIQAGDLIYASGTVAGATTFSRLGIGTSGQALVVSSGLPSWGSGGVSVLGQVATAYGVTNSVTETEIFNVAVPANTLGDHNRVDFEIVGYQQITANEIIFRLKYGGTTLCTITPTAATVAASSYAVLRGSVTALGSASIQRGHLEVLVSEGTSATLHAGDKGDATVDSSAARQLVISAQPVSAATTNNFTREHAIARAWSS